MTDEAFIEEFKYFAASKDPNKEWSFGSPHHCALAQFVTSDHDAITYRPEGYFDIDDNYHQYPIVLLCALAEISRRHRVQGPTWGNIVTELDEAIASIKDEELRTTGMIYGAKP